MDQTKESNDAQLHMYYAYVRNWKILHNLIIKTSPDITLILTLLNEIEILDSKLEEEYWSSIKERKIYYISESVIKRSHSLFEYLSDKFLIDNKEEQESKMREILETNVEYLEITRELNYNSIYNAKPIKEALQPYLRSISRFCYFEEFFFWLHNYYSYYKRTIDSLWQNTYYLPTTSKYYIAIMAVSIMKSEYMLKMWEEQFLVNDGDEMWWILGLEIVPKKLKILAEWNQIFADQPCQITVDILKNLRKYLSWNEIVEACVIMVEFQKWGAVEVLLNTWTTHTKEKSNYENDKIDDKCWDSFIQVNKELEKNEAVEDEEQENQGDFIMINSAQQESNSSVHSDSSENDYYIKMFTKHLSSDYQNFSSNSKDKNNYLRNLDFNWSENGIYVLSDLFKDGIKAINDELIYIQELAAQNEDEKHIIVKPNINRAMRIYVDKLYFYYHEDFRYAKLNQIFGKGSIILKFMKNICYYPDRMSIHDFDEVKSLLLNEEIIHLLMLTALEKSQMQLVFLSKAISELEKVMD